MSKSFLHDPKFKKIASKALLNQPATIERYEYLAGSIRDHLSTQDRASYDTVDSKELMDFPPRPLWQVVVDKEDYYDPSNTDHMASRLKTISSKQLNLLSDFDTLEAVALYRNTLNNELSEMLSDFAENGQISKGLYEFLISDCQLCPFTSYPVHHPRFLLFSRPFQRVFDDFYLIEDIDVVMLGDRANAIYNNFADILFEFFRYDTPKNLELLEEQTKQLVYQWNVAATNFDSVRLYLESVYGRKDGSGKYHVFSKGIIFKIIDLESNEVLPDIRKYDLYYEAVPMIFEKPWCPSASYMAKPFDYVRPCDCFVALSELRKHLIPTKKIISDLKSRFLEFGWDYDKIR